MNIRISTHCSIVLCDEQSLEPLIKATFKHADDETTWLVLADKCDELGEPEMASALRYWCTAIPYTDADKDYGQYTDADKDYGQWSWWQLTRSPELEGPNRISNGNVG